MMALAGTLLFNPMTTTMKYEFGNGPVQIDNPMIFQGLTLSDPEFIGAGGGGAVYSYKNINRIIDEKNIAAKNYEKSSKTNEERKIVIKISWKRSTDSVRNECDVLRVMEQRQVTGVERCLGIEEYRYDSNRVVVGMVPFVEDQNEGGGITASIGDLSPDIALKTVTYLMRTMAQMLAAGVVTNDVQPLISKSTGEIVLIDMTEATVLYRDDSVEKGRSHNSISNSDKILISAFCTEVIGLIPDSLLEKASESFLTELHRIETETNIIRINDEIKQIIKDLPITGVENLL
ncbi:MAG: hypothetical protein ACI90V_013001 [Bacillariaceae sp.]|jgi:hypothetical protein